MSVGILSFGGYLPKARLCRKAIFDAHAWFSPGLRGLVSGARATANWDEDAVTMAVEAARSCLAGRGTADVAAVYMGSTSYPFRDRQNAGIVADALRLPRELMTFDLSSSQRAGSSALMAGLAAAKGSSAPVLVLGSEKRDAKPASALEMTSGDGAAALLVGAGDVLAELVGSVSHSVDFVDHFRGEHERFDYGWEERWIRDEGYLKIVPEAVAALLAKTGVSAEAVGMFCFPAAMKRVAGMVAKQAGIAAGAVQDNLIAGCGETGAAHPLVMLVHALERASAGDLILVAGFGQGADALLFRATERLEQARAEMPEMAGITAQLARGRNDTRYNRYLSFNGNIEMERGIRAEIDKQTKLTAHYRTKDMAQGMIGGKCTQCGTRQFPKARICVSPNCTAVDTQVDEPFADKPARINSFTKDQLTYTPDPPTYFGMVQFEGGGRLMSDFTDIDPEAELAVGDEMRMVFRIKDHDGLRGFRRYFWKAAPAETGQGGV